MDPYWLFLKTVAHTVVSLMTAAAVLFGVLPEADDADSTPHRLMLASFTIGSAQSPDLSALARRLHHADAVERARAACQVKKIGDQARALIADLSAMLADDTAVPADVCGDSNRSFRGGVVEPTTPGEKAAEALARIGTPAYDSLAAALKASAWHARKNAAWGLGALEDPRAVEALASALDDREPAVRRSAAWALGAIEDARAVPSLIDSLKDTDPETRAHAAWALGAIGDERAIPALSSAIKDANVKVRRQAAWALGAVQR